MGKLGVLKAALATLTVSYLSALWNDARAEEKPTLARVFFVVSPKWYLLKKKALEENILIFRKYSIPVIDEKMQTEIERVKNILDYGCQRTTQHSDYIVFHLPEWVELESVDRKEWIPRLNLRVALDGLKYTFDAEGEFKNGSLFVDLTDQFKENLMRLLVSEEAIIDFGQKSERLTILQRYRTPDGRGNIAGFIEDAVSLVSSAVGGGSVQSMEMETMLRKCMQYKKNGRY